jgi:hypothetical protein
MSREGALPLGGDGVLVAGESESDRVPRMATDLRDDLIAICRAIDAAEVRPRDGAARIWRLIAEADYPPETEDFRVFVGAVSEIQDHPEHQAAYEDDIRAEARAAMARHGGS